MTCGQTPLRRSHRPPLPHPLPRSHPPLLPLPHPPPRHWEGVVVQLDEEPQHDRRVSCRGCMDLEGPLVSALRASQEALY